MNRTAMNALVIAVSVLFAVIRVAGHKSEVFQAFAHLWVGGLFGAYAVGRDRVLLIVAVVLSLIELACFLVGTIR